MHTISKAIEITQNARFKSVRWRTLCLVLLLILGQAVLLHHVVLHHLEQAIADDDSHCSFCAIGGHMASNVPLPQPSPSLIWTRVVYLFSVDLCLAASRLQPLGSRGPPLPSVV